LARRLEGTGVTATCLHPGGVATGFGQRGGLVELGWRLAKPFMISAEKGAESTLFLATIADATPFNGGYVVGKVLERPGPAALDDSLARRLLRARGSSGLKVKAATRTVERVGHAPEQAAKPTVRLGHYVTHPGRHESSRRLNG